MNPFVCSTSVQFTRSLGGYFRRFRGGLLQRWARQEVLQTVRPVRGTRSAPASFPPSTADESKPKGETQDGPPPPKTFADLVASASEPSLASFSSFSPSADTTGPEPAALHSADEAGVTPLAGPIEIASESEQAVDKAAGRESLTKRMDVPEGMEKETLTLAERATLAWLVVSRLGRMNVLLAVLLMLRISLGCARPVCRRTARSSQTQRSTKVARRLPSRYCTVWIRRRCLGILAKLFPSLLFTAGT